MINWFKNPTRWLQRTVMILAVLWVFPVYADRSALPVQGYMVDFDSGTPLDGAFNVTFNLYDGCGSPNAFTSITQNIIFDNGLFTTKLELSAAENEDILASEEFCLGTQLEGDIEMAPRLEYFSAPYTKLAERSDAAASADVAATALSIAGSAVTTGGGLTESGGSISLDTGSSQTWTATQTHSNQLIVTDNPDDTTSANASFLVNPGSSDTNDKFFVVQDNGSDLFTIDKEGDITLSGSFTGAGLTDCDAALDKLLWDASTATFSCGTDTSGGAPAWDTIADPTTDGSIAMEETDQTFDWNTATTAAAFDGLSLTLTNDATTDANTQRLLVLENLNAAGSTATERLLVLDNADIDEAVTTALEISSAAGGVTTAIDVSDAEIATAIALGFNDVTVAGVTLDSIEMSFIDGVTSNIQTQLTAASSGDIEAVTAGAGLTGGGTSGAVTVDVGAGNAITVNANDIAVTADSINQDELAATLTFADGDFVDLSSINASGTAEGLKLPQATDVSAATAEGQISWDTDADTLYVGDGSETVAVSNPFGSAIDSSELTNNTITGSDLNASVAGAGLTGGAGSALAIGAGTGISVAADTISATLGTAVDSSEITDNTVSASDLSATLSFADSDLVDLSSVNASGTGEGLILPQATDVSAATAEGQLSWDTDGDTLYVGDGTTAIEVGNPFGAAIDGSEITNDTVVLTTDTAGNYVATITAGGGMTGDVSSEGSTPTLAVGAGTGITVSANDVAVDQSFAPTWTGAHTFTFTEAEDLALTNSVSGTQAVNVVNATVTNSSSSGTQNLLVLDNAASSGTTESLLVLDNSDTDTAVTAAIQIIDAGGTFTSVMDIAGTLLSATELGRLDGKDAALVDSDDTMAAGDVSGSVGGGLSIDSDAVTEAMLKAVDTAADEECLTYETTTGDFEWQSCAAGAGDIDTVGDCSSGSCFTGSTGTSLTSTTSEILDMGTASTLIYQRNDAGAVTFRGADNAGAADTIYDTTGAGAVTVGSADVTSMTVTTDGTGDAEVVLPTGSISGTEILNGTIASADISGSAAITDGQVNNDLTISSSGSVDDGALSANVSLLGSAIASSEITDNTVSASDLAAALTFADGDLVNLSSVNASGTAEGLILPQATDVSAATAEGQISWDTDGDTLYVGDGSSVVEVGNPFGAAIDSSEITNGTIVSADISGSAAITDGQVNNDLTISSSGSVDDGALSANVSLLGSAIASSEITDNTITASDIAATVTFADADFVDLAAVLHNDGAEQGLRLPNVGASPTDVTGTNEGYLAYDQTNNEVLVNTGAAWANVNPFGSAVDLASEVSGTLPDGNVSDTITVGASGSVNDSALSANVSLLGSSIASSEITDNTVSASDLAAALTFADGDLINLSSVNASGTGEGLILPQATDVSASTAEGQLSWDTDGDTLYVGDGSSAVAVSNPFGSAIDGSEITNDTVVLTTDTAGDYVASFTAGGGLTGDASGEGSTPTLAVGAGTGITVNANDVAIDQAVAPTWTGDHAFTQTVTATGSIQDVNITLGNDADVDTVSGINIDATSAATGDADILYGLNVGNLSSANGTVLERAIRIGSGWDEAIDVNGTLISLTELGRLDGIDAALVDSDDAVAAGDLSGSVGGGLTIDSDAVTEAMLKAVDTAADEECLTYETTTGDFEWQACDSVSGDVTAVGDCSTGACFGGADGTTLTSTTSEVLNMATANTLIYQRNDSGAVTFRGADDAGAADTIYDTTGAGAITVGSADVTAVTVTTDGTGDAEVVLPTGSISGTEILNDTVVLTTDTAGNYVATITAGGGMTGDVSSEGSTPTLAVGAGTGITVNANDVAVDQSFAPTWTGAHTFTFAEAEDLALTNSVSGTQAVNVVNATVTNSSSSGTQNLLVLDNAASSGTTESLLVLDNSDTDTAVTAAIQIIDAGGTFTSVMDIAGTLLSATELGRLDGLSAAIVDSDDAVAAGDISGSVGAGLTVDNDAVTEAMLKAVDTAGDEECLTYETTTGDFEWQSCAVGSGDIDSIGDCANGACFTGSTGTSLTSTTSEILDMGTASTLIYVRNDAGAVTFMGKDNDANGDTIYDTSGTGAITVGSADVTAITLTTDGTGDAEVVLPAGSISGTEILNDTVALTTDTAGNYVATITNGTGISGGDGGGEGSTLTLSATLGTSIANSEMDADTLTLVSIADTLSLDGADLTIDLDDATNDYNFVLDNSTTGAIAVAMAITTTGVGGTFATAIDLTDAGITNGISLGANAIVGTTGIIDYTNFDVDASGNLDVAGTITAGSSNVVLTNSAGNIQAGAYAANSVDISADTNLAAGRGLTLSGDSVEADAELYTEMASIVIEDPTASDTAIVQLKFATATTMARISCSTDTGTATIQFDERVETTPNTVGTDVMSSTLVCDTNNQATTSFANAAIAADAVMNLDVDAVASTPTVVRIHVDYTRDD